MKTKTRILIVFYSTLAGTLLWLGTVFFAPYLRSQSSSLSNLLYALFSSVCHQIPSRSFICFGYPLAVCARCLGIYVGFLGGVGLYPIAKGFSTMTLPKTWLFLLLSLPIGIDALGNFAGLWITTSWLRFVFGGIWGFILPFYFIYGIVDLIRKRGQPLNEDKISLEIRQENTIE